MPDDDEVPFPDITRGPVWQERPVMAAPSQADLIRAAERGEIGFRQLDPCGSVVFDASPYVKALIAANGGSKNWHEDSEDSATCYLRAGRKAAAEVGRQVYEAHGHEGMVTVFDFMVRLLPRGGPRELEYAWDGIGEWRA